jgi:microcystin degradation protein MlrC
MNFRIGILSIQHESNTFLPGVTTLDDFRRDIYAEGPALIDLTRAAFHELGGFIAELDSARAEIVPILFARALPSGIIEHAAADQLIRRVEALLRDAGPLDGLLVAPHGAGVSQLSADFDGFWLARVRGIVGPDVPIVCTIDPHANLSQRMVDACDAMVAYRTNPHLDQRSRGVEAAQLLLRHLRGELRLCQAASLPPLVINIERQLTRAEPCLTLYQRADTIRQSPGVLSVSVVLGFPYADVVEMGAAFIAVTDGNRGLAEEHARSLSDFAIAHRHDYAGRLLSIDQAIERAIANSGKSVLLDMGDNVGGGGPANETALIGALIRRKLGPSVATVFDENIVRQATALGVGGKADFEIGAVDPFTGKPLSIWATVVGLYDGKFTESQPRHGGATHFDMGPTAVLDSTSMTLIVTSRRLFPVSLEQYRACGIDISEYRYIVAKGVHAPIAAYEPLGPQFIHVNTPGVTSADLTHFKFSNRRRPLFPFEELS